MMSSSPMISDRGLDEGVRVRISDGCGDAGRTGSVIAREIFVGQWWCVVLWDDAEDPDLHKSSCLEPLAPLTPEDWGEVLHTLTREMRRIVPDNPVGMRRDRIMGIVGKIGSGDTDGLDGDERDEIRRSLEADIGNCVDAGVRLRTILGKIVPSVGRPPVHQAVSREELLARVYLTAPLPVAKLCDEELDTSGALLGRVRDLARADRS